MREMGIEALYRKPRSLETLTRPYDLPCLLERVTITEANRAWAADITYIPKAKGFCYLVGIMGLASRKDLSFRLSNTLYTRFCIEAYQTRVLLMHNLQPVICNEVFPTRNM